MKLTTVDDGRTILARGTASSLPAALDAVDSWCKNTPHERFEPVRVELRRAFTRGQRWDVIVAFKATEAIQEKKQRRSRAYREGISSRRISERNRPR